MLTGRRKPTLEIHIPISPTPYFFNMVHCLALSLRANGGDYRNAPIIVTAGDDVIESDLPERLPWLKANGIELRWAAVEDYKRLSYFAQGQRRLTYEYESDVVLFMDADMLVAGPFGEVVEAVFEQDVVAGVIAYNCAFDAIKSRVVTWSEVFEHCGMRAPRLDFEHTGWGYFNGDESRRFCPAYFNYGFVCMPTAYARRIGAIHEETRAQVRELAACDFDAQIALTVAIARLGLPVRALPVRYNFANHASLEALHAAEIAHARILHLCGGVQINKLDLFKSLDSIQTFAKASYPRVINAKAQRILRDILPALLAEERMATPLLRAA